jgi:hypothetical protein
MTWPPTKTLLGALVLTGRLFYTNTSNPTLEALQYRLTLKQSTKHQVKLSIDLTPLAPEYEAFNRVLFAFPLDNDEQVFEVHSYRPSGIYYWWIHSRQA